MFDKRTLQLYYSTIVITNISDMITNPFSKYGHVEILKVNETFSTTIEIIGNESSKKAIILSHGIGMKRDDAGLLTAIAEYFRQDYLCILFDYNSHDLNNNTTTYGYEHMKKTLESVNTYLDDNYSNIADKNIVAHSLGCVITSFASLADINKTVLLAPPTVEIAEDLYEYFSKREGSKMDLHGVSEAKRSNGTTTYIPGVLFKDMKEYKPLKLYRDYAKKTKLSAIRAIDDPLLPMKFEDKLIGSKINYLEIPGDHKFSGDDRDLMLRTLEGILSK